MLETQFPARGGGLLNPLRRAATIAWCAHLLAGLAMALVLRYGLETNPILQDRIKYIVGHRAAWTSAWFTWTLAALAILYFFVEFAHVHQLRSTIAVLLTVAALGPDLAAQTIEIGVLPSLANHVLSANAGPDLFLTFHRFAVMLSGCLANGLYSLATLILARGARHAYPAWITVIGVAVGVFGIALSVAALADSASGMFWTNVFLIPSILLWLGALSLLPPTSGSR
jgi:hypothetical protein